MKFLIRENFFKSVPKEKLEQVLENLKYFYLEVKKNYKNLKDIPKGFWIKKLAGVENRFEFRINNGDRVFFSVEKKGIEEEKFTLLLYSSHDRGVKKAKRTANLSGIDFKISQEDFVKSDEDQLDGSLFLDYNNVITYEIKDDNFFKNTENKYFYYYLNDKQYETITLETPLFVVGSAGSGKSTITLRKILNIEENNEIYEYERVGYFTENAYLKDNLLEQYEYFRDSSKKPIAEFYTLKEYYKKYLKVDTRKIINYKKFREFLNFSFPNRKRLKLEDANIYFEITGLIKGFMGQDGADNWERNIDKGALTLEEYRNLGKKYTILDDNLKQEIYKIYAKYEEWKNENHLYDFNDLAQKALSVNEKFDFLLVDEVQDLTEIEIYFLSNLVKNPKNIIFAGDIHQMVNFNTFSFDRLKNFFYKRNVNYNMSTLVKNYRSSKDIVKLANHLTDLRQEYIGNLGTDDYKEGAILDEGSVIFSDIDYTFAEKFQGDVNAAIIVASEEEKLKLKYDSNIKYRIFTVDEIKGLEYKNIICYNLISNNVWAWDKILKGLAKQDQRYRKYFNIFYVGITRARQNLIIMEDEKVENEFLEKIKTFMDMKKSEKKSIEKEKLIENTVCSSKEDWLREGEKQYKLENFDEAQHAFEQGGYPTWILEKEIEIDISNSDYKVAIEKMKKEKLKKPDIYFRKLIIDDIYNNEDYVKALKYLEEFNIPYKYFDIKKKIEEKLERNEFSKKDLNRLVSYFIGKKEFSLVGDLYFAANNFEMSLNFYKKCNNNKGIIKARGAILAEKFKNTKGYMENISKVQHIIGNKSIDAANKNGATPMVRAMFDENSTNIAEMLLSLGADIKKQIRLDSKAMGSYIHQSVRAEDPVKWLKFFHERGLSLETETNNKETPFFYAVLEGRQEAVNFLIQKGCNIDHSNQWGQNILFEIVKGEDVKQFKFFADKIKNLKQENDKKKNLEDVFKILLDNKFIIGMKKEENMRLRKVKLMYNIYKNELKRREKLEK